jgi:hypothetical protein
MKVEFSVRIFEKSSNIKIRPVGPSSMRADGHEEANHVSQFCERV